MEFLTVIIRTLIDTFWGNVKPCIAHPTPPLSTTQEPHYQGTIFKLSGIKLIKVK